MKVSAGLVSSEFSLLVLQLAVMRPFLCVCAPPVSVHPSFLFLEGHQSDGVIIP